MKCLLPPFPLAFTGVASDWLHPRAVAGPRVAEL